MLNFQIEFSSGLSVYRQLAEQIRFYIVSGVLNQGDKLPSVRGLSKELKINPATVVKAYNTLQQEEFIELKQGLGAFVIYSGPQDIEETSEELKDFELKIKGVALLAHRLGIDSRQLQKLILDHYQKIKDESSRSNS